MRANLVLPRLALGSNENALGPSPKVGPAVAEHIASCHRYPQGGVSELRTAIAARSRVHPEQVLVANGSADVLLAIGATQLSAGVNTVVSRPTFYLHVFMTERAGAELKFVPTLDLHQDLDAMANAVDDRTRLVVLTNPHSPTGTYVADDPLRRFVDRLPDHVVVVIDEAYREYADADDFADGTALVRAGRPVIVTRTFSKAYGLAGMRVGYAVTTAELATVIEKYFPPFHVNSASTAAALAAWNDPAHLGEVVELNATERIRIHRTLTALGLRVIPTQANFLLVLGLTNPISIVAELDRRGITVRATESDFGLPGGLRLTTGTAAENTRLLAELAEVAG